MRVTDLYSLNDCDKIIDRDFKKEFGDILSSLSKISVSDIEKITSKEQRYGENPPTFYSPKSINNLFKKSMNEKGWLPERIKVMYDNGTGFREIDFYDPASKIGIEMQLGKYSFMSYDVFTKMPIMNTHGLLDVGIEIVPSLDLRKNMCSGIGHFDQLVYDIKSMGIHCHKIPVVILAIDV